MEKDAVGTENSVGENWEELLNEPSFNERLSSKEEHVLEERTPEGREPNEIDKIKDAEKRELATALLYVLSGDEARDGQALTQAEIENNKLVLGEINDFLASGKNYPLSEYLKEQLEKTVGGETETGMAYSRACAYARDFEVGNKVSGELGADGDLDRAIGKTLLEEYEKELEWMYPSHPDYPRVDLQANYSKRLADGEVSALEKDLRRSFAEQGEEETSDFYPGDIKMQAHRNGIQGWVWLNEVDEKAREYANDYEFYAKALDKGKELLGDYGLEKPVSESADNGAGTEELDASVIV